MSRRSFKVFFHTVSSAVHAIILVAGAVSDEDDIPREHLKGNCEASE